MEVATTLGRNGLQDWLIQRVTGIILASFMLFLMGFFLSHSNIFSANTNTANISSLNYASWHLLFSHTAMRYFTLITLLSLIAHAWIGLWTIITDYIKPLSLRLPLEILSILILLTCTLWGIHILWAIQ